MNKPFWYDETIMKQVLSYLSNYYALGKPASICDIFLFGLLNENRNSYYLVQNIIHKLKQSCYYLSDENANILTIDYKNQLISSLEDYDGNYKYLITLICLNYLKEQNLITGFNLSIKEIMENIHTNQCSDTLHQEMEVILKNQDISITSAGIDKLLTFKD